MKTKAQILSVKKTFLLVMKMFDKESTEYRECQLSSNVLSWVLDKGKDKSIK